MSTYKISGLTSASAVIATNLFEISEVTVFTTVTFVFANAPANTLAAGLILELTNGGNFTVTWPSYVKWPFGNAPTLTTGGTDLLVFITDDNGTNWRGVQSIRDSR
jgi:hypothetical protein